MSFEDCLNRAHQGGEIDGQRLDIAKRRYRQIEAEHRANGMSEEDAAAQAAIDASDSINREIVAKRYADLMQIERNTKNAGAMRAHRNHRGEIDPSDAIRQFLEHDHTARFTNVISEEAVLNQRFSARLQGLVAHHSRNLVGSTRNRAKLDDIVRELGGVDTGNKQARAFAAAWREASEEMRITFNRAGGDIPKLKDWDLPHRHRRQAVIDDAEQWKSTLMRDLEWHRIVNHETGLPFAEDIGAAPTDRAAAEAFLDEIREAIRTDNWSRQEPRMTPHGTSMVKKRAHPRTLHFKSPDAWLSYNEAFGEIDPFGAMMQHMQSMARDTALMRILGPNPRGGLRFLEQVGEQIVKTDPNIKSRNWFLQKTKLAAEERYQRRKQHAVNMFDQLDGAVNVPEHESAARFLSGTRQTLTAIQLGSATLSAVSDFGTTTLQAAEFGGSGVRMLSRSLRLLNPANKADHDALGRAGIIADHLLENGNASARFTGELTGNGLAERLAHATMRLSGLSQLTSLHRRAVQLEFMGVLADNAALDFDAMNPWLRLKLESRGINAAEWDAIRATQRIHAERGNGFLVPDHIRTSAPDDPDAEALASKLHAVMMEQMELAVPSASLKGRALLIGQSNAGSFTGELARSGAMYKSFALSLMFNQIIGRYKRLPPGTRAQELLKFGVVMTALGGIAINLKEMSRGRDPQDMTTGEFWGRAVMQGGGLGIFGDFLASTENRLGGGLAGTLAGPVVGVTESVVGIPVRLLGGAVRGEETNLGRETANLVRRNTPVASSLWYVRAAYDRLLMDELQEFLDPEARQAQRRRERKRIRDYGNRAWWGPGDTAPARAPDLSSAVGGTP